MLSAGIKHIHFIGIGGYGMSALALILLQLGYRISGSDIKSSRLTHRLQEKGAIINFAHDAANLNGSDMVVYSTAIPNENAELVEARRRNIPLWHRAELLALMVNSYYGVAVAGTHGKTTTTAMLSLLLDEGGFDPTAVIGGEVNIFEGNARLGKSRYLVAEACESDNSFLRYHPRLTVITNIEADHLENFEGNYAKLQDAYSKFIENTHPDGVLIVCGEDSQLMEKARSFCGKVVSYGIGDGFADDFPFDFTVRQLHYCHMGSRFEVYKNGDYLVSVEMKVPGRHNVLNATASIAAAYKLGVDIHNSVEVLGKFTGAGRRFEVVGQVADVSVVDDYAHHPTEIKATLQAAQNNDNRRIICIFQPHRFTRTQYFLSEYADSFQEADIVFLNEVYGAGEKPIVGANSRVLAEMIKQRHDTPVYYHQELDALVDSVLAEIEPGDVVITMGAGDIWKAGRQIVEELSRRWQQSAAGSQGN